MKKILIVEDDRKMASAVSAHLKTKGHLSFTVHTAEDAIEQLETNSYDLIILDLILPDRPGDEILKWKQSNAAKNGMPVIVVSGEISHEKIRDVRNRYSVRDYIAKPCSMKELSDRVQGLLELKHKVACIGGGSGLYVMLLGLKELPGIHISSIVGMSDDGGSTGRLREAFGVLPPGDLRRSLVALSKAPDVMNKMMVKAAVSTLSDVDLILFVVECDRLIGGGDEYILSLLKDVLTPAILVLNKVDMVKKGELLPIMERFSARHSFKDVIPVSAMTGDGVDVLLDKISSYMSSGPRYFPDDIVTDCPERFVVSELIREKVFSLLHEEIPYKTAVDIEQFREEENKNLIVINAVIYVDREPHKRIIIGKGGGLLRKIGTQARKDMEALLGAKVYLEIFVKVKKGWSSSESMLRELGIDQR